MESNFLRVIIVCIITVSDSQVSLNKILFHSSASAFACSFHHHLAFVRASIPLDMNVM